ncbi:PRC-barrel domain-containing protein [Sulfitobacter sp.]|uniref:PRC-barrel domain-containing protein n=1 Tax=Sulfitobacter sp. TaxID=1903071 RepID=UPI0030019BE9
MSDTFMGLSKNVKDVGTIFGNSGLIRQKKLSFNKQLGIIKIKRLLTTTAIMMSLTGAAFAESHSAPKVDESTAVQSEAGTMDADTNAAANADVATMDRDMKIGSVSAMPTDFLASNLIGMRIYNVEADMDTSAYMNADAETEWNDIGEINDVLITADGKVSSVILGVGGFLGIGERDVSVPMSAIEVLTEEDGEDRFLVVKTSKEELEATPAFEREAS